MIDVCILISENSNLTYLQQCFASLKGQPCRIKRGSGDIGTIASARIAVYDTCKNDLLSWVDPDDTVTPGIFKIAQRVMDENPTVGGCYTFENYTDKNLNIKGRSSTNDPRDRILRLSVAAHHLVVVRRRVYEKIRPYLLTLDDGIDWALVIGAYELGGILEIPIIGYNWRRHEQATTEVNRRSGKVGYTGAVATGLLKYLKDNP